MFLQVGFSTMSTTALTPLICYGHPNGQRSNLKHPNIICGSPEHTSMVVIGSLLLAFGVCGFFALCCWLAYMCPKFSSKGRNDLVQSARFLLGRFRLDVWWYGCPLLLRGSSSELADLFRSSCEFQKDRRHENVFFFFFHMFHEYHIFFC